MARELRWDYRRQAEKPKAREPRTIGSDTPIGFGKYGNKTGGQVLEAERLERE